MIDLSEIKYDILDDEFLAEKDISITVKRLDLLHPYISGNKWFKIKYNLQAAKDAGADTILTFGGAYSNHIIATAAAARMAGLKSVGVIRGEEIETLNPMLQYAQSQGMQLEFISRSDYKKKHEAAYQKRLMEKYDNCYIIPEGGANKAGVEGAKEILSEDDFEYDYICCACGTATTFAGMILSAQNRSNLLGFSVLKGVNFKEELDQYFSWFGHSPEDFNNYKIVQDYHFGGYAKKNQELMQFIHNFNTKFNIPIEPVYTGKLFYGIFDKIKQGHIKKGSSVLVVHCGGV